MKRFTILCTLLLLASIQLLGQYKQTLDPSHLRGNVHHSATIFIASDNLLRKSSWIVSKMDKFNIYREYSLNNYARGSSRYHIREYGAPKPLKKNRLYMLGEADDSTCVFAHSQGLYLGGFVQEKGKPTFLRDGIGIDRAIVYGKDDAYKYYIGHYRKNKKHGNGFYVNAKGEMYAGIWKKGRLLRKTKRELTEEEKDKITSYMGTINHMM